MKKKTARTKAAGKKVKKDKAPAKPATIEEKRAALGKKLTQLRQKTALVLERIQQLDAAHSVEGQVTQGEGPE